MLRDRLRVVRCLLKVDGRTRRPKVPRVSQQARLPLANGAQTRVWVSRTFRAHRAELVTVLVLYCVATVFGLAGPQILGRLVDSVTGGGGAIDTLALVFLAVLVAQAVLRRYARLRGGMLGERVLAETREGFVEQALLLPLGTVEAVGTGDLLSRATTDSDRVDFAVRNGVPEVIVALITVLLTTVAMVLTSPLLALGLVPAVVLIGVSMRWYWRRVPSVVAPMLDCWADVQTSTHETADGARTAEALGLTEQRIARGHRDLGAARDGEFALRRLVVAWLPSARFAQVLPLVVILLIGAWAYERHLVALGTSPRCWRTRRPSAVRWRSSCGGPRTCRFRPRPCAGCSASAVTGGIGCPRPARAAGRSWCGMCATATPRIVRSCTGSTCGCHPGSGWRSWGRPGPGSPRWAGCSPVSRRRTPDRSPSAGRRCPRWPTTCCAVRFCC